MNALNTNQVGHESGRFVHLSNEMVLTSINIEFYVSRFEPTVSHNKFFFFRNTSLLRMAERNEGNKCIGGEVILTIIKSSPLSGKGKFNIVFGIDIQPSLSLSLSLFLSPKSVSFICLAFLRTLTTVSGLVATGVSFCLLRSSKQWSII